MAKYTILRKFFREDDPFSVLTNEGQVIKTDLTLEEAQAHCRDPETSSSTCTLEEGRKLTEEKGPWFDCYTEEPRIPRWAQPWRHERY